MTNTQILKATNLEQAREILTAENKLKSGKIKQGRAFNFMCYLQESEIQRVITQNRRKIRSYAYALHDKDTHADGSPEVPHYHIVLRTYSQFTLWQAYAWFKGYLFEYDDDTKQYEKISNLVPEFTGDLRQSVEYLYHKNDPDKYQYNSNIIVSDDLDDVCMIVDKSFDNSYEIVDKIISGASELELLKTYGREYVYHRSQYRELAYYIRMSYSPIKQIEDSVSSNDHQWQDAFDPYTYTENYKF